MLPCSTTDASGGGHWLIAAGRIAASTAARASAPVAGAVRDLGPSRQGARDGGGARGQEEDKKEDVQEEEHGLRAGSHEGILEAAPESLGGPDGFFV